MGANGSQLERETAAGAAVPRGVDAQRSRRVHHDSQKGERKVVAASRRSLPPQSPASVSRRSLPSRSLPLLCHSSLSLYSVTLLCHSTLSLYSVSSILSARFCQLDSVNRVVSSTHIALLIPPLLMPTDTTT